MTAETLSSLVAAFGRSVAGKLSNPAVAGSPEDQLRGPLETLVAGLAALVGLPPQAVHLVGETHMADLRTRPDYAVTRSGALIGFIEVKAPGKGCDPRKFSDAHDKDQWNRLKSLPNLLYTDGNGFSLWRDGALEGGIVRLEGDVESAGGKLVAPATLVPLFNDFLTWSPTPPRTARRLAEVSARLCRLLRDEVTEQLALKSAGLTGLAEDWRKLLFPQADDAQFADGYAQAVTFGLLIARTRDISLKDGVERAASELRKTSSLIGTALGLLTDSAENQAALKTSLGMMARVFDTVNWPEISKDDPEAWLYFYEHFLEVYDNALRKRTGSYYTPPEVVDAMARLVDEALRGPLFERPLGLASADVTVADPAVGSGAFLLGVLRRIAGTVEADLGPGAVPGAVEQAAQRLIGFELQFGPFAVAQLRLMAEFQALMRVDGKAAPSPPALRLFITDTLGNPFVEEDWLPQVMQPVAKSRRDANAVKRGQPITVVIGNPPYKEKAKGRGGWIEEGSPGKAAPMARWEPPVAWGAGAHAKHLKNLYIYFWRWAAWKVFGSGHLAATGLPETDEEGIVCYITVAGFLNGPGFQKMRADLRETCSEIWVVDCSPEGHQPEVATRIFQGVQQPVCIVIAARKRGKARTVPARVRYRALPEGRREAKFAALEALSLDGEGWVEGADSWRGSFLPEATGVWADFPELADLFLYNGSGVMPGRTWIIAPDAKSLSQRWDRLTGERDAERKELLFHPHQGGDKTSTKKSQVGLSGHEHRAVAVKDDARDVVASTRYGFRSFDRQWIVPDARLINRPNPTLWDAHSGDQIYLTSPEDRTPENGPALTLTELIPDLHHYNGRGGRVFPLWRDAAAKQSNIAPAALAVLSEAFGRSVAPPDVMAYVAALLAHPAFTARFQRDLVQPGLRLPLSADAALFDKAVALGREVVWLHAYGERFHDAAAGRPKGPPRLAASEAPRIPAGGAIPGAPTPLPDEMDYDPATRRLSIGAGFVENVMPEVFAYEVSGKQVLRQWFSYRRRDRTRPIIGDRRPPSPLDLIQPEHWLPEYTTDLMNLLHVLGRLVLLEPRQAALLQEVLDNPLIPVERLRRKADHKADSQQTADHA